MRVIAKKSFVASVGERMIRASEGEELEMPDGVDWLNAGLVEPVRGKAPESASIEPSEKAIKPKTRKKKPAAKKKAS
jgi:hypothetical protein